MQRSNRFGWRALVDERKLPRRANALRRYGVTVINWEALGAIGELAGSLLVLGTFVYLAAQIRQNTKQLKLSTLNQVVTAGDQAFEPIYNLEVLPIWHKGHEAPESLTAEESTAFSLLMTRVVHNFQNVIHQHENGALDSDVFRTTYVPFFVGFVHTKGGANWLRENRSIWLPSTLSYLDGESS